MPSKKGAVESEDNEPQSPPLAVAHTSDDILGREVATARSRLGWSTPEFANLLNVSVSTIGRWESFADDPIPADPHGRRVLIALLAVLDNVGDARERLTSAKDDGPLRLLYTLLGLYYGDTPWTKRLRQHKQG